MKTMRVLASALTIAAAAAPAIAGDLLYDKTQGEEILSEFHGRPYWEMQAYCAGFHGATANYWAKRGESARSKAAELSGVAAFGRAVAQIRRDRGIDENGAVKAVEPAVQVGGRVTTQALREDGTISSGKWNYWRSFCIDADAAFVRAAR